MPTYNQLAASSLLNQQYNAALGMGTVTGLSEIWLFLTCTCSWSSPAVFVPVPPVPGFHGIPTRRAPMVEQAVQTVPLASASQKRGKTSTQPQGRQPVRPTQRSGRRASQVQKENVPTSKQS